MELDPGNTPRGGMPLFEVAKALAFDAVIYRGLSWKTFCRTLQSFMMKFNFLAPPRSSSLKSWGPLKQPDELRAPPGLKSCFFLDAFCLLCLVLCLSVLFVCAVCLWSVLSFCSGWLRKRQSTEPSKTQFLILGARAHLARQGIGGGQVGNLPKDVWGKFEKTLRETFSPSKNWGNSLSNEIASTLAEPLTTTMPHIKNPKFERCEQRLPKNVPEATFHKFLDERFVQSHWPCY